MGYNRHHLSSSGVETDESAAITGAAQASQVASHWTFLGSKNILHAVFLWLPLRAEVLRTDWYQDTCLQPGQGGRPARVVVLHSLVSPRGTLSRGDDTLSLGSAFALQYSRVRDNKLLEIEHQSRARQS